ncbi:hypothetical protein BCV72DRAFT_307101 [Rhizopus microsporus var. microsporus]|uniref:Uncharacterized protein n=2 Tax=Rhizopus microsporus TaxID=58291 RepID=A0A2G4T8B2_RHIZD|nr:uncharacterized protein RHIMIDRAFT_232694 [Rhizopus microsporus ATCC 52813]ORE04641.1 hypothetical protein BCV72DRAFT_307101 [Rhizopus microsporus var. microsporus]PHZ17260.1 hypothetical protein RHIMIDRAFT_232694 [Rhizopus microsporus ATCC 52813]
MRSDIRLRSCPRQNSSVNSTASNRNARKSPVITHVLLHDNQTKKQIIDLPQPASDASAISIVTATSSSSASLPSKKAMNVHRMSGMKSLFLLLRL